MIVVRIDVDLRFHVLDKVKEMVQLGQGTFATHRIDEETQRRAIAALKRMTRLAERRGVREIIAVATSAVREAENGGAFLQEVYHETGVHPRVISGAEEARLIFKAVMSTQDLTEEETLVVDLGGGSVEFAQGTAKQLSWATSTKLGVARLAGQFMEDGRMTPERREALGAHLRHELAIALKRVKPGSVRRVVVTSGSAGAVLRLLLARGDVEPGRDSIPVKPLASLDEKLTGASRAERRDLDGLEPARVDLIVPAVAFFRELTGALGVEKLTVSDVALREGVVYDFIDRRGADLQWELTEPNTRRRAILQFGERHHYDAPHGQHVAHLAVQLFDATATLHGLGEDCRELLEYGALIHDVGYSISAVKHHKHSEYLILNGLTGGFTAREIRVLAGIARYHRKSGRPKKSHENWEALDEEARAIVLKLSAIQRIADGLDRSHNRVIANVRAEIGDANVVLELDAAESSDLESWAARRKADRFEEVFGRVIELRVKAPDDADAPATEARP